MTIKYALEAPVWDAGLGAYVNRKLVVSGCMAHSGHDGSEPQFRVSLGELCADGTVRPLGYDSISPKYLEAFTSQIPQIFSAIAAGGERDWCGIKIDLSKSIPIELTQ